MRAPSTLPLTSQCPQQDRHHMKIHLFIVDPQNDFCVADEKIYIPEHLLGVGHGLGPIYNANGAEVSTGNKGSLVVPGADADMARVAKMIDRLADKIDDIHVTMDSHQTVGIERPKWWKRVGDGAEPAPFTILGIHPDGKRIVKFTADATGLHPTEEEYTTYLPSMVHQGGPTGKGSFGYLEVLSNKGRYPHVVWPEHCIVGTWGWSVVPDLAKALSRWERNQFGRVNYIVKGNNPYTEHFSGVQAEVPDPSDPATQVNARLIQMLEEADMIAFTGEALSHCVANTGRDIVANFSDPKYAEKLVFLTDTSSNVPGFDFLGDAFLREMKAKGMKTSTTQEFLA